MMNLFRLIILFLLSFSLISCAQGNRSLEAFKQTKAYALAQAVDREDVSEIERLVLKDSTLMDFANPLYGSNVLVLSIITEKYKSFLKLLELGANPNLVNPYTKGSVLIDAIRPYGSQINWRIETKYIKSLLEYGANPNYAVEYDFTDEKGHFHEATSPLMEASGLDIELVKLLVNYGADPNMKVGISQHHPFSQALSFGKIEIIDYYIDSLYIDIFAPLKIRNNDSLFLQDYVVNKYTKAKIIEDTIKVEYFKQLNKNIDKENSARWRLIEKLEKKGVDFKHYHYKL